jgi:hypothetical protein
MSAATNNVTRFLISSHLLFVPRHYAHNER